MASNTGCMKNYTAGGAISPYRIVKFSADYTVVQAAAATDALMGVSGELGVSAGELAAGKDRVDIWKGEIVDVEFGGTVARGAAVTSDANGKAVAAAPSAGANVRIIGFAEISAVSGDIAPVWLVPGVMQG